MNTGGRIYDVCIIGAGVVGCAIARELSRYNLDILLVEKSNDVANGATKANSGIVHGGYSAKHGTAKGSLCRKGNSMYRRLEEELSFGYRETGSLVLAFDKKQQLTIRELFENGRKNEVERLEILSKSQLLSLEPKVSTLALEALYCPGSGVTSPYEFAIALAENAVANGVELRVLSPVVGITKNDCFDVTISSPVGNELSTISSRFLVNAAGLYSDRVASMVTEPGFAITPRQGQYVVFGREAVNHINSVVFQTPTQEGKGILVTPTYHRNLMIGPNADEVDRRENVDTDQQVLAAVIDQARVSVPDIDLSKAITTFAGVRATSTTGDFVIGPTEVAGYVQAAGIDSPGLTSSPAIAERVRDGLANEGLELVPKRNFQKNRAPIIIPKKLPDSEVSSRLDLDTRDPIICRCEQVTRAEILDGFSRGVPVLSIDAVKRRTRAGQGPCQGGFCRPRVAKLLADHLGRTTEDVLKEHDIETAEKRRIKARFLSMGKPAAS